MAAQPEVPVKANRAWIVTIIPDFMTGSFKSEFCSILASFDERQHCWSRILYIAIRRPFRHEFLALFV